MVDLPEAHVSLREELARLRGDRGIRPRVSIVVPVNAQADLVNVLVLAVDIAQYDGDRSIQFIVVINNYSPESPPAEIETYRDIGFDVIEIPKVEHQGEVMIAARIPGIEKAESESVILFDADCRIPNPTALIDWYADQFDEGFDLAYTHVDYTDLPHGFSVKVRMFIHHASRWVRRVILGIPTCRGSNYAIRRELILRLFAQGRAHYEIRIGPAVKSEGGKIAYSSAKELVVCTSGRFFSGGWKELFSYLGWRMGFYRRVVLSKSRTAAVD